MWASQVVLVVKNPPANSGDERDTGLIPGQQDPLEEGMVTHSSIHGQRSLAGYSPWGHKESDTPENAHARLDLCTVSNYQSSADNKRTQVS